MGWLLDTKQRAELDALAVELRRELALRGVVERDVSVNIAERFANLSRAEVAPSLSHLLSSAFVLGTNESSLAEKDSRRLWLKFADAAVRLGEGEEFGDAESRQNYLAGDLVADIDETINPATDDDFLGNVSVQNARHQIAVELCQELNERQEAV